jgi:zinc D-Ala-D-Ala carboxypeptidase
MVNRSHAVCLVASVALIVVGSVEAQLQAPAPWTSAAASNAVLRTEMQWQFGTKEQRGWSLYLPLIVSLLKLDDEPDEKLFATSVAAWQRSQNLPSTGVIENETWKQMMTTWQSQRIPVGYRGYPPQSELATIAVGDLYDPERPIELRQVERRTYEAYQAMIQAATVELKLTNETKFLKIISAFRDREYQEKLRRQSPQAQRTSLALNSTHFTGRALDLYVGGEPVDTKDENRVIQTQTAAYRWLAKNARRFGFRPYFYEPWHWEYSS